MESIDKLYSYYIYRNLICSNFLRNKGKFEKYENGSALLLWGPSAFVGGDFSKTLAEKIISESDKLKYIYFPDEKWYSFFKNTFPDRFKEKILNLYQSDKINVTSEEKCIIPITQEFLNSYSDSELIKNELYSYTDSEDFFTNGIGLALVIDNRIYGYCLSEYSVCHSHGINIRIDEKYRRMGYAAKMTNAFLNLVNERKEKAYWVCDADNIPSNKTAASTGFSLKSEMRYCEI